MKDARAHRMIKSVPTSLSPWETYYGLHARPFSLTPDLRFAFQSASHTHALQEVTSALNHREGLVVVTGEVGTGKTMLCRTLLAGFERRTFLSVVLDPMVTIEELLTHVLTDFGLMTPGDANAVPVTDASRHKMVTTLQQFLASLIPLDAQAVILIDEAQHLNPAVLEEIRLLANFETDEAKLLQIVLVGQPSLTRLLRRPELRQLAQRIARRCRLTRLSKTEVAEYVERRLAVAAELPEGVIADKDKDHVSPPEPVSFSSEAMAAVVAVSHGIPRLVNTLCDRALQAGYDRQLTVIDRRAVVSAARHLRLAVPARQRFGTGRLVAFAAALVIAAAAGGGLWWMRSQNASPATGSPSVVSPPVVSPPVGSPSVGSPSVGSPSVGSAPAGSAPAGGTPAASPSVGSPPVGSPPASSPAAAPAAAARSAGAASAVSYEIAVASFRTSQRADSVADDLAAANLPVSTRPDSTGTWILVIVGPYPTSGEAESAKATLAAKGFTDVRVMTSTPAR